MANVAQQFKQFDVQIDGGNWLRGLTEEFHPPTLEASVMEYQASGMDMPVLLDMGMEPLTARIIINGYHGPAFNTFGQIDQTGTRLVARGSLRSIRGEDSDVVFTMNGNVVHLSQNRIRGRGELPRINLGMALVYYKVEFAGVTHIEIDVLNFQRFVGDTDVLRGIADAVGFA